MSQRAVETDAARGGHAMYLAIVPASGDVRPNTNNAMAGPVTACRFHVSAA
jgi:hypothetical protein